MRKKKHGGVRKGAGRPVGTTTAERTVVMRIPLQLVAEVKGLISHFKMRKKKDKSSDI